MRWAKVDKKKALRDHVQWLRDTYGDFYRWFAWRPVHDGHWLEFVERRDYFADSGWRYISQYQAAGTAERNRNEVINGYEW